MEEELTGFRVTNAGFIATTCQLEYFKHTLTKNPLGSLYFPLGFQMKVLEKKIAPVAGGKTKVLKEI